MRKYRLIILLLNLCFIYPVSAQMDRITFIQPLVEIPIKHHLGQIQLKDFDGDSKIDLAGIIIEDDTRSSGVSYQAVSVWRNLSDENNIRFAAPKAYGGRTKTGILRIWAQDVNGDNRPDIIVFGHSGDMEVYINRSEPGDFRFDKHIIDGMPNTFVALFDLELADMNSDGKIDLVVSYGISPRPGDETKAVFAVLKNTSVGNTVSFEPILLEPKRSINKLSVGDLDGDGKADLVTYDEFDETLDIRRNLSTEVRIQFSPPDVRTLKNDIIISTRVTDVNKDGKADIMVLSEHGLTVLMNKSRARWIDFSDPQVLSDDGLFLSLIIPAIVEDVDGDGLPDIVAREEENIIVIENLSKDDDVRFNARVRRFNTGSYPSMIALADINGDHRQDIISIKQPASALGGAIIVLVKSPDGM